jgi:hypothetical protein
MKINFYAWFCLAVYASDAYSNNYKITQMIYVKKESTHDRKENLIYYVGDNNKLYAKEADEIETTINDPQYIDQLGSECKLCEESKKDEKYRTVNAQIMLIGQPMIIDKIWTMPAVIKKRSILGGLLRPELCIIKYESVNLTTESEPFFKKQFTTQEKYESEGEDDEPLESNQHFIINKIGEGHRTKVTKIGLLTSKKDVLLISGSEWPTVKVHSIDTGKLLEDYKDTYLIDVVHNIKQHYAIMSQNVKDYLWKKTDSTSTSILISTDGTLSGKSKLSFKSKIPFSDMPNISIDPKASSDKVNNLTEIQTPYEKLRTYYISTNYLLGSPSSKKTELNLEETPESESSIFNKYNLIEKNPYLNNNTITANAFDFEKTTFFYATYDKKYKQTHLFKDNLKKVPKSEKDDESSSEEK